MGKKVNVKSFYIQPGDTDVAEWVSKQYNLSHSLRWLVKQAIAQYGMTDYQDSLFDDHVIGEKPVVKHEIEEKLEENSDKKNDIVDDTGSTVNTSEQVQTSEPPVKSDNGKINLLGLDKSL